MDCPACRRALPTLPLSWRTSVAAAITCTLTAVLIAIAADTSSAGALSGNYTWMGVILGLDVLWAVSYTLWPRRASKNG